MSPLGGFEDWSKKIRAALLWLGCDDPCDTMTAIREEDPQRGSLLEIMEQWHAAFGESPMTIAEVIAHAEKATRDVTTTNSTTMANKS